VSGGTHNALSPVKKKKRNFFRSFWFSGEFTRPKFMFYLVLHMDRSILFIHYLQMISFGDLLIQRLFLFCVDVYVCVCVCVLFFGSTCIEL
jgi:hypothetical protein